MAHEEERPSALSDNQVKACGKPSAETWESRWQTPQTLFKPPPWALAEGAPPTPEMGAGALGVLQKAKGSQPPGPGLCGFVLARA